MKNTIMNMDENKTARIVPMEYFHLQVVESINTKFISMYSGPPHPSWRLSPCFHIRVHHHFKNSFETLFIGNFAKVN